MIVLGITDIHGNVAPIEKIGEQLKKADVVCISGDITHFGGTNETGQVIDAVSRYAQHVLAVSGNCDYRDVEAYLEEKDINLHAKVKKINGVGFLGLGGSLETPFNTPNEYTEADLGRFLGHARASLPKDLPVIMVSHQPPFKTACDKLSSGQHIGSREVYAFIKQHQPLVCFTGHIHESVAIDNIGKTQVVNPGQLGHGHYAYAEIENGTATVEIRRF